MKKNFKAFFCGVLACMLVLSLCGTAIAATTNIPVSYGIKVLFDGQSFQPKDGAGRDVQLFSYNGTVYAPIRAVCEKAGLRVDYDGATNTASVMSSGYEAPAQTAQPAQPAQTTPAVSQTETVVVPATGESITFTGDLSFMQNANWKESEAFQTILEQFGPTYRGLSFEVQRVEEGGTAYYKFISNTDAKTSITAEAQQLTVLSAAE